MVLEIAILDIAEDETDAFAAAYRQAREIVRGSPGCQSMRMTQGIERPTRFVLLVEWDDVEAHERFRAGDGFTRWRGLIGRHFAAPPVVEHFTDVD